MGQPAGPPDARAAPLLPQQLRIRKPLGRGGFSRVFAGTLERPGGGSEPVALKVLSPMEGPTDDAAVRMFMREAACQMELANPTRCVPIAIAPLLT